MRWVKSVHLDARKEGKVAFSEDGKETAVWEMAECVEQHGARESGVFEEIEVVKNLPPNWARVVTASV
jgi:hypothetical protein